MELTVNFELLLLKFWEHVGDELGQFLGTPFQTEVENMLKAQSVKIFFNGAIVGQKIQYTKYVTYLSASNFSHEYSQLI